MVRVLVADDHAIMREGLRLQLAPIPDFVVEAISIKELEACRLVGLWNVVVMNVAMPGDGTGLDMLRRLKHLCAMLPVLVISIHPEDSCGVLALKSGAAGYIRTNSSPAELAKAVRKVAAGGKYITPSLAETLAERLHDPAGQPDHDILSAREFEVFVRLAAGERPTSIANSLNLSIKTVSTYRSRILDKLRLKSNCQLVHYAIERDLIFGVTGQGAAANGLISRKTA